MNKIGQKQSREVLICNLYCQELLRKNKVCLVDINTCVLPEDEHSLTNTKYVTGYTPHTYTLSIVTISQVFHLQAHRLGLDQVQEVHQCQLHRDHAHHSE